MKIGLFLNVDGVLTETQINLQIAKLLGIEKEQATIEKEFLEGRISPESYNKTFIPLLRGANFTEQFLAENFHKIRMRYHYGKLLSLIKDTYLVSSGPSYFVDIISKNFNIPSERVLCSQYEFDKTGKISQCTSPINPRAKVKFVKKHCRRFDLAIGVAYSPEFDSHFLNHCHIRVLVDDFRLGFVCVKEIETLNDFIENLHLTKNKFSFKIYNKFSEYDSGIQKLHEKSQYERNVFIMTPFRDNIRYRTTIKTIKEELKKRGLKGWVASDLQLHEQLWHNVQCFLLGCKFGVAIFAEDTSPDSKNIHNPNVSIELGYMMSRGKDVLFLKDKLLKTLPTDIMGSLYENFDLDNPDTTLPAIMSRWLENKFKNG